MHLQTIKHMLYSSRLYFIQRELTQVNFLQRTEGGAFYFIIICPVFLNVYYNNNLVFLDEFCVVLGSQLARALSVCFSPALQD